MARLDRLGPAKEVAQIGAAIGREFSHALLAAVARKQGAELQSALDRLIEAGLLFRQGLPPHATYLFKHALVQDAAYGTLLRGPRRALHARIAETVEDQFSDIAESEPELLARHCTEAGLIEKAALLWGRAGERSLLHSALVEATQQLTRALTHLAATPGSPALRREELRLQVALIYPLMHLKGYAAPETKAAVARARLLIEQTDSFGALAEDPMLLLSVLFGSWVENLITFNGDVLRELAAQFLALAEKQQSKDALLVAHNVTGLSLLGTGAIAEGRAHLDLAIELYDPVQHRAQAMRFGPEIGVANRCWRAWARWLSGYPNAALSDAERAVTEAREIGVLPHPRPCPLRRPRKRARRAGPGRLLFRYRCRRLASPYQARSDHCARDGSRRTRGLSFGSAGRAVNVWQTSPERLRGGTRAASIGSWLSMEGLLQHHAGELR
jgi:hypothetical protein